MNKLGKFTTFETGGGKYKIVTQYADRDAAWDAYTKLLTADEEAARKDDQNFNAKQLLARAAKVLGLDPDNTSWFEVVGEMEKNAEQLSKLL